MIFYFSGTGNSRWVAECVGKKLGEPVVALVDFPVDTSELVLRKGERLGFVFPVYSWAPPQLILQFIRKLCVSVLPEYVYFVCTCGDDIGKTADVFRRAIEKKGWKCSAGFSVTMPNSYVCLPGFDVDPFQVEVTKLQRAVQRVDEIADKLEMYESVYDCHEGSISYIKTYLIRPFFERYLMSPALFKVTDACISCGKCEKVCPLHNIYLQSGKPQWGVTCTMCLACYHHCPTHAIAYGRQTQKKGQYVFSLHKELNKPLR